MTPEQELGAGVAREYFRLREFEARVRGAIEDGHRGFFFEQIVSTALMELDFLRERKETDG